MPNDPSKRTLKPLVEILFTNMNLSSVCLRFAPSKHIDIFRTSSDSIFEEKMVNGVVYFKVDALILHSKLIPIEANRSSSLGTAVSCISLPQNLQ